MITENAHIFVMVVCLLVVIVLMIGLGGFAFGGEFNKKYANKLMRQNTSSSYGNIIDHFLRLFFKR